MTLVYLLTIIFHKHIGLSSLVYFGQCHCRQFDFYFHLTSSMEMKYVYKGIMVPFQTSFTVKFYNEFEVIINTKFIRLYLKNYLSIIMVNVELILPLLSNHCFGQNNNCFIGA